MSPPPVPGRHLIPAPRFYVTPTQRVSPGAILLAILIAVGCVPPLLYAVSHSRRVGSSSRSSGASSPGSPGQGVSANESEDDEDPSQVDTIYLGGPDEAPVATRPEGHARTVHPFVVVQLPRSGDRVGQIPNSPAGHLLYDWLAAFNSKDLSTSGRARPGDEVGVTEAQTTLRRITGGFTLLSAKEIQPGVLVFRLHDQTPSAAEVMGTLEVRPFSRPPAVASFSLRATPQPPVGASRQGASQQPPEPGR